MLLIFYSIIFIHKYISILIFTILFDIYKCKVYHRYLLLHVCIDEMSHFRWNLKILYLKINCLVADISVAFLCCWEWLIWVNQAAEHLTKNWYDCRLCTFNQYFKLPLFLENVEVVCEMRRWIRIYWLFQLFFPIIDKVYSYWIIIFMHNIW